MKEKRKFNINAVILIILFAISISPKTLQNDTLLYNKNRGVNCKK